MDKLFYLAFWGALFLSSACSSESGSGSQSVRMQEGSKTNDGGASSSTTPSVDAGSGAPSTPTEGEGEQGADDAGAPVRQVLAAKPGNPEQESIKVDIELEVYRNRNLAPIPQHSPLLHVDGQTYLVWMDEKNRPFVSRKSDGKVDGKPLDDNTDYAVAPDSHNGFSIGIDRYGYLHIMGDMHHYPSNVKRTPSLPKRYTEQNSMYWISNKPYDVNAGFKYVGGLDSPMGIPGSSISYPHFHHAPNGDLYLSTLTRAHINPSTAAKAFAPGAMGLGLYKYKLASKTWEAIGGYPDVKLDPDGKKWKVLFWEESGTNVWFQGFIPGVHFENNGTLHVAGAGNIDPKMAGGTFVFYAKSPDAGKTWQRANGSAIPSLPLRGVESSPSRADVVLDTKGSLFLDDLTRVVVDHKGTPLVWNHGVWRRWDGMTWNDDIDTGRDQIGYDALLGPDQVLTFLSTYFRMARSASADSKRIIHTYDSFMDRAGPIISPSDIGLRTTGAIFAIDESDEKILRVVKMTFN